MHEQDSAANAAQPFGCSSGEEVPYKNESTARAVSAHQDEGPLRPEHLAHLLAELGEDGLAVALGLGARSVDPDEALELGFRFAGWRGGGLLMPFGDGFAQLRCDDPPTKPDGDRVKYLNVARVPQRPLTVGSGDPVYATEGFKDAVRLHLATGKPVQAIPGVQSTRLLAKSIELLIYDADAKHNPCVWVPLIRAGLERSRLRLGFFPSEKAGPKGGACEFFNAGGDLSAVRQWKPRELLRELPSQLDDTIRVDWQARSIRCLARLAAESGMDRDTALQAAVAAAKRMKFPSARAREIAGGAFSSFTGMAKGKKAPECPQEPTKQELQEFIRAVHRLRFNELKLSVEIDGMPMDQLDLADSFLAHLYGIEINKQAAKDSFLYVARSSPYNPVAEYLEGLRDKSGLKLLPLAEIAAAFGIAPDDALSQELLARHLIGGYRRGIQPGYKHDQVLIFGGHQGGLKGEAIRALSPPGMCDSCTKVPKALEDREFLAKLNSVFIFELDEVEKILQGRDAAEFKGFVTRKQYRYVQKYETECREHPARALLFATTNCKEILNDHTGDRRVWLVPVGTCAPKWIRENRDSIWGTVATWASWGAESWLPAGHESTLAAAERARGARISEVYEGKVRKYLERYSEGQAIEDGIALDDLIAGVFEDLPLERVGRDLQMGLTRTITGEGFTTHGESLRWEQNKRRYRGGAPRSGYVARPVPSDPTRSGQSQAVWNGATPWHDSDLQSLFQPFQPSKEESKRRDIGIPVVVEGVHLCISYSSGACERKSRNGRNGHQTPCAGRGLSTKTPPITPERTEQGDGTRSPAAWSPPVPPGSGLRSNGEWVDLAVDALTAAARPVDEDAVVALLQRWGSGVARGDAKRALLRRPLGERGAA